MSCPQPIGYNTIGTAIFPQPCKRWDCPYCARWKKWLIAKRVAALFEGVDVVKQITITQRYGSRRNIMKDWEKLRRIMQKVGIKIYSYFWSKEFTIKGQRHLHIIADLPEYVDQKWLSDTWRTITKGESFRVWINEMDISNAAGYAMKYLTKAYTTDARFNPGENRYGFCRTEKKPVYQGLIIMGDFWERIAYPLEKPVFTLDYSPSNYYGIKEGTIKSKKRFKNA